MRKKICFDVCRIGVIILSILTVHTAAQDNYALGFLGGLNISSLRGEPVRDLENHPAPGEGGRFESGIRPTFIGGIFFRWVIVENFLSLEPELIYGRGGKEWESSSGKFRLYTDYLSVPTLVRLMMPMDIIRPNVFGGPVVMFALGSKAQNLDRHSFGPQTFVTYFKDSDLKDHVRRVNLGLTVGLGCDFVYGPGAFVVDARYQFGFLDVYTTEGGEGVKDSQFSLLGGYTLYF